MGKVGLHIKSYCDREGAIEIRVCATVFLSLIKVIYVYTYIYITWIKHKNIYIRERERTGET